MSTNICFTWNNYPEKETYEAALTLERLGAKYVLYGKEIGKKNGVPHLQGQLVFKNPKSFKKLKELLPECHLETTEDLFKSIQYCKKDGDFTELGVRPLDKAERGRKGGDKEKERWELALANAKKGRFEDIDPQIQITQARNLEYIHLREVSSQVLEDSTVKHQWYYGKSGTGKSRKARTENPDAYLKMCNKWWDHYKDEPTVLIEDFDKKHDVLCHHLKIWSDRYPFLAEIKGASRKVRPKLIIVTSNYHPRDIWTDEQDLEPILRRFHVTEFLTL